VAAVCSQCGKRACWEELWLGGKLPIDLRFSPPPYLTNANGTDADSDTEEEPEEDCLVRMERGSLRI
jgi:hypothetical protein